MGNLKTKEKRRCKKLFFGGFNENELTMECALSALIAFPDLERIRIENEPNEVKMFSTCLMINF